MWIIFIVVSLNRVKVNQEGLAYVVPHMSHLPSNPVTNPVGNGNSTGLSLGGGGVSAAIFSPTVARQAASTARDWNFVDSWLASRWPRSTSLGGGLPPFERNPDTLKALLALAALNEAANDERDLLGRAEAAALAELRAADTASSGVEAELVASPRALRDAVLGTLEASLTREGRTALESVAALAESMGLAADPAVERVGAAFVALQGRVAELEQQVARVEALRRHVGREAAALRAPGGLLAESSSPALRPAPDVARTNLELQRRARAMAAKVPEVKEQAAGVAASVRAATGGGSSIDEVRGEEGAIWALLAQARQLEAQISDFGGLPPDPDLARERLDDVKNQLENITQRRDAMFEGLVE